MKDRVIFKCFVVGLCALFAFISAGLAGERVTLIFDSSVPQYAFTASEIKHSLAKAGFNIIELTASKLSSANTPLRIIITKLNSEVAKTLQGQSAAASLPSLSPEGYVIRKQVGKNYIAWWVIGADETGALYGGLEVAEAARVDGNLDGMKEAAKNPFIGQRGLKFNMPLDARNPSYSDSGESGQMNIVNMWDAAFWHEFIDEMARDRLNTLTLWSLHPFPSMVKVPEYPNVALNDVKKSTLPIPSDLRGNGYMTPAILKSFETVKKITINEKIAFWRDIMEYACGRGVSCYIITWNAFVYGTEESGYNFTHDMTDAKTIDYFRKSVKAMIKTYPLLKGIGVTAGENLEHPKGADKTGWLWKTYGKGINDALAEDQNRRFTLIHRGHQTSPQSIARSFAELDPRCVFDYEYKYSQAHMYSSVKPLGIYQERFLAGLPKGAKTWLTARDDDYYMFRWGDADFMRAYIINMPTGTSQIRGVLMGPDGYTWGREYISKDPESPRQLVLKKKWMSAMLFGRLSYDPKDLSEERLRKIFAARFPEAPAPSLVAALAKASRIIPTISQFHYEHSSLDFLWYPEACVKFPSDQLPVRDVNNQFSLHTINDFIQQGPQPGSGMMGIKDYVPEFLAGERASNLTTPPQVAATVRNLADDALQLLRGMPKDTTDKELKHLLGDIEAMSYLGQYYASKIQGALNKALFDKSGHEEYKRSAISQLKEASKHWHAYAAKATSIYEPQFLTRFLSMVDPKRVDLLKLQEKVDQDIVLAGGTID